MGETVVVAGARTPFGRFGGALASLSAPELGARAIRGALKAGRVDPAWVEYAFLGQVVQAGSGQIPSRQATIAAGLPETVPSDTVNKVCASGLRAVNLADMAIRSGSIRSAVAGGMESMSRAPFLLGPEIRSGWKMGDLPLHDAVLRDGLWCAFNQCAMGALGDGAARELGISRRRQDEWALLSHRRALAAWSQGRLGEEVTPVSTPAGVVQTDEAPRPDTSLEKLAALAPAFSGAGSITAGNAPGLSDGAAALVLMDRERARELELEPLAAVVSQGWASRQPSNLHEVPALAGFAALKGAGLLARQLDRVEINEAFAVVTLYSMDLGGFPEDRVNVNGGAIALGHPIGASGARILLTLIYELTRRGGGYGLAMICSGGGQGEATLIRVG